MFRVLFGLLALGWVTTFAAAAGIDNVGKDSPGSPAPAEPAFVAFAYDAGTDALLKTDGRTIYRSGDGGKTWKKEELSLPPEARIASIAASPAAASVAYIAGKGLGVWRTDDAGKSWSERNEGLASKEVTAVAAHTTQPDTVYAVVPSQGIYRSQDAGKTWRLMERGDKSEMRQLIHSNMPGSMQTGWLYAATPRGVRRTMDCFCLWQTAGDIGAEVYGVSYEPARPERLYAATGKGLFHSTDGGENWTPISAPETQAVAVAVSRAGTLYVLGREGVLFESGDGGASWKRVDA